MLERRVGGAPVAVWALVGSVILAGCTSGHSSARGHPSSSATTPASTTSSRPTAGGPSNLPVTAQVRGDLIATGAALDGIPASEYSGLRAGLTYYPFDPATETYWAGAGLVGATMRAQVSTQDDGSYMIFHRTGDGAWIVQTVGLAGVAMEPCPSGTPPPAVVALWGWQVGGCKPNGA